MLLVGAWLALSVALPATLALLRRELPAADAARVGQSIGERVRVAEAAIGTFVVLLHLRRRARGVALVLPFAALTLVLAAALFLAPLAARAAPSNAAWIARADLGVTLGQALLLFACFVVAFLRHVHKR